jgi:glutamyl-tRNA synthetase
MLRIEDTDTKRNTPTAMQQVIDDLRWLGIEWDEGPEVGGPNGPYLQSQRKDIYDKYVRKLIEQQKAYYCFDTQEELETMRDEAEAQKKSLIYRRPADLPNEADVKKAIAEGKSVTVRFAVPQDSPIVVNDIVRGEVTFSPAEIGDFIILKSDGFPTYNFACVVDDELMGITHVIRGQEHLMNTPAQQMLQQALGFGTPLYAHMSVTVSEGGGKLSKRERPQTLRKAIKADANINLEKLAAASSIGLDELNNFLAGESMPDMPVVDAMAKYLGVILPEINVVDFFRSGYLPETMVNFLALLGWNPGTEKEIMPVGELISLFDLSRLTKSNSLFDRSKLLAFNTEHIRMLSKEKLRGHFRAYLKVIESPVLAADDKMLDRIIQVCEGARTLADIERKSRFVFLADDKIEYDKKAVEKVLLKDNGLAILEIIRSRLEATEQITEEGIEKMLRTLAEEKKVGLGKVAQPLRVALCGSTVSLPIFEAVIMLGREKTLARIDIALKRCAIKT